MKVYFIGDIGNYSDKTFEIFFKIYEKSSSNDIIILLGDNFYPNGINKKNDTKWNYFTSLPIKNKVYGVLGNHDYLGNIKYQINNPYFILPYNYYSIYLNNIDIFVIDTSILSPNFSNLNYRIVKNKINDEPVLFANKMLKWLDDELSKSKKNKIIIGHYPILSKGNKACSELKEKLTPILNKYNVKYYISGHDHNLQFIDNDLYKFDQLISGSGSNLYPVSGKNCFRNNGFIELDISKDNLNIFDYKGNILMTKKMLLNNL